MDFLLTAFCWGNVRNGLKKKGRLWAEIRLVSRLALKAEAFHGFIHAQLLCSKHTKHLNGCHWLIKAHVFCAEPNVWVNAGVEYSVRAKRVKECCQNVIVQLLLYASHYLQSWTSQFVHAFVGIHLCFALLCCLLQTNVHAHLLKNGEICTVHRENSENNKLAVLHSLFQDCHSLVISPF